jgi:hypothetical protein
LIEEGQRVIENVAGPQDSPKACDTNVRKTQLAIEAIAGLASAKATLAVR